MRKMVDTICNHTFPRDIEYGWAADGIAERNIKLVVVDMVAVAMFVGFWGSPVEA